ncbi:MAG: hypothetical protein A2504_11970 [Bdellovibrionales bacterium RIFOXYD12_FULL_39_22]|nr:MAG: hypothetical protein A2385_16485 [Bdellovibrionales bacterium RIFOXYB1_FULL_39_21]OFZ44446.1 MAG: hypothetical protein A2485_06410 [Bdellovibrionales bacterium RIFOXYC12_FULL_39_17]OFZ49912.1 MAG: hypothetical protein A2404_01055 [Bdellovibrionales bacterium RIFOXYC1_FULL_39_130]OFZ76917.1 MAG: hypothetical protein A2560_05855 [Bdellovibrionales bacterium RIFOXYD1_FULL_39_84]OFZ95844.1 MAG: hypothetical protein A2504_11970 [Bdellovibrionales bacterium RIFOXYD12_FULL_39_22]HLE10865.1 am
MKKKTSADKLGIEKILNKYADLILDFGIAMRPGQKIIIQSEPIHKDFIELLAQKAYERGAQIVHVELNMPLLNVHRSNYQKDEFLPYIPSFKKAQIDEWIEDGWSLIALDGMQDPDVNKKMNQDRNAIVAKANVELRKPLSRALMSGKCYWTIAALPTPLWAEKVTKAHGTKAQTLLWKDLISILRLNKKNPIAEWKKHSETLKVRCSKLNQFKFSKLHFVGEGTDLTVGLTGRSKWLGGGHGEYFPNLPSEEIFTSPDFRQTEGSVKITRPVNVLGDQVIGAWFKFGQGQVIDYGAEYGKHLLDNYFKIDPQAKYLGEVALVDRSSPIFKSGRVFHNILFDENAACHIALGRGFPIAFENADNCSEVELTELGCNQSLLHTDFMVGHEKISVDGVTADGKQIPIIVRGKFTKDFS